MGGAKMDIPSFVEETELLDRVLFEPSFFCDGRLAPSAFALTAKSESFISVFRHSYYNLEEIEFPHPRSRGDSVAGIAQLKTADVKAITSPNPSNVLVMSVEAKNSPKYPFHAGIFAKIDNVPINSGNAHTIPLFMYVQKELVRLSSVILFDDSDS